MTVKHGLTLVLFAFTMMGCDEAARPEAVSRDSAAAPLSYVPDDRSGEMTGSWFGVVEGGYTARMSLAETADGRISGTGTLGAQNVAVGFRVQGRRVEEAVDLTLTRDDGQSATYSAILDPTTRWPKGIFKAFGGAESELQLLREQAGQPGR